MSFHHHFITIVASLSLTTAVLAADTNKDIPTKSVAANPSPTLVAVATASEQKKIDINKATAKELMAVKGLTTAKSKAIVQYRKKHGNFKSVAELKKVRGFKKMKEKALTDIQNQLSMG